jgi:hypothetical protein
MLHIIHFEGFSKVYISIHHEFTSGMSNWCFCNGFVINLDQFDVYEYMMHGFLATGRNHSMILHLLPRPVLHSTLDLTLQSACNLSLRAYWSWQLVHWWPLMDESVIWVLFPLVVFDYRD